MAHILADTFAPPFWLPNGHVQTIVPHQFLNKALDYRRERIWLKDGDFLDLDWLDGDNRLVVLCHGLEGNSASFYMSNFAEMARKEGISVLAWNFRGCSGEDNLAPFMYHSGSTSDLEEVMQHIHKNRNWDSIWLAGFSLGGNLVMKFAGEMGLGNWTDFMDISKVKAVASLSGAFDIAGTSKKLDRDDMYVYHSRFLTPMKLKLIRKKQKGLVHLSWLEILSIKSIWQYDDLYTAPANGYKNAIDYYTQASALPFLKHVKIPSLIISSYNDPIISENCFPKPAHLPDNYYVCYTQDGGHISFWDSHYRFWALQHILRFFLSNNF